MMNTLAKDIFVRALELASAERDAFLAQACGDDADLKTEIQRMLVESARADSFFGDDCGITVGATEFADGHGEKEGDVIGPYKLRQAIGEGGFGTVWMAEQSVPISRMVALKVIKAGMDTKQVLARFEAERQALAMMDHPHIAKVLDAGATPTGRPWFAMELVKGIPITDYCDQAGLGTKERLTLFRDVCSAINHAHQKGIIHRDIKPSNVMVTLYADKPVVKVIDFGIAKATQGKLTDQTLFTRFEQFIGTPVYMSPEQAALSAVDIDTRSDIYALGILLYELLVGKPPFDAKTLVSAGYDEMRRIIREVEPPKPSSRLGTIIGAERTQLAKTHKIEEGKLNCLVEPDLDWIVMKAIDKDRTRRYETANAFAQDILRFLADEPVTATPPSAGYQFRKFARRNKAAFRAAAMIVLLLVVATAVSSWQAVRATRAEKEAVTAFNELRATAPAFAEQARGLAARERYDEAIEKLDYAIKLRPEAAEFLVQKADLLQCQFKLAEAAALYRAALALQSDHARAEASLKLCDDLLAAPLGPDGKLTRESLGKLHLAMQKQQRPAAELLPVAQLLGAEREHLIAYWLDRLKDLPISLEKPLKDRLTVREDDLLELDLKDTQITDLALLAGMPLGKLTLWNCRLIADFTPLREFRSLTYLDLDGTQIADLSVLRVLPLEELYIGGAKVSDLSPLRGIKLKTLEIYGCRHVSDLSPLVGMPLTEFYARDLANGTDFSPLKSLPLEKCVISEPSVTDLSFLASTPLKELGLHNCKSLRGLNWLNELKSLERLVLPGGYRNLPADDLQAIAALRNHPRLAFLQSSEAYVSGYEAWRLFNVTQSKEIFWRDWDREQTFLPAIREAGFTFSLTKLPDDTYALQIEKQPLRDLSFLKGAPISSLWIGGTKVTDLSPIADLPLRSLGFWGNAVTDIGALRKMRLEELSLGTGAVADLSPLADMPLQKLYMHQCKEVGDLSPILKLQTLQSLTIPVTTRNIEALRSLKNLKWLGFRGDSRSQADSTPAEFFWKRWPGMAWSKALNGSTMDYTATQSDDGLWSITVKSREFSDCGIFKGAAIRELTLQDTSVSDLRPLEGLALTKLNLQKTAVTDLTPLRGMPLKDLNIYGTRVTDLTALRGMQLSSLILGSTQVTDLSPLEGMRLAKLHMSATPVADISALRGMPLIEIRMPWCPQITDLTPLSESLSLESISLPPNAGDIEVLRHLTNLRHISHTENSKTNQPDKTTDVFWKEYDEQRMFRALPGAANTRKKLADATWELDLGNLELSNLEALKELPVSSLKLGQTKIASLKPLQGMKLKKLAVNETWVTDLSPLRGMPLEQLNLANTKIAYLAPLKDMPLTVLNLRGCSQVKDLAPLENCRTLRTLVVPPNARNLERLKALPLERIGYKDSTQPAAEFWADVDANPWQSALRAAGFPFKKLEKLTDGSWEVDLKESGITDLKILSGARISTLRLGDTEVSDLAPLRGMPLKRVTLYNTKVTDLGPLAGMRLDEFQASGTAVDDISVLRGMPLRRVRLHGCTKLTDLTPLVDCSELTDLTLPPNAKNFEFLRDSGRFPKLSHLSFVEDAPNTGTRMPDKTCEQFWNDYDVRKK